jgi:uncharacterized membrane protein (UPF0127 family)
VTPPARAAGSTVLLTDGELIATTVSNARTFLGRLRGFLGRRRVSGHEAVWLEGVRTVHSFGVFTTLDLAFVDRGGRILTTRRLRPCRLARGPLGTTATVEFAAGRLAAAGVGPGHRLERRLVPGGGS